MRMPASHPDIVVLPFPERDDNIKEVEIESPAP